ncbi:MAG TPA: FYDLN acid domain-containing protein [Rickettsiales bacterium]|nr:FYDLN acid domain-containing protein [Rickettsiales bacterium]
MSKVSKPNWGTKRNCTACGVPFYDLNHNPASCPKCGNEFDPTVAARAKRKAGKRNAKDEDMETQGGPALKQGASGRKMKKKMDDDDVGDGIGELMEIEDVDDIENLHELSELEEVEENSINEDDADEEALIEELDTGDNVIVENVEDEEAMVLVQEIEDEEQEAAISSKKKKK